MKKHLMKSCLIGLLLALPVLFVSCNKDSGDTPSGDYATLIVGTWHQEDIEDTNYVVYESGGKYYVLSSLDETPALKLPYSVKGNKLITLGAIESTILKLTSKEMQLETSGIKTRFTKVK